MPRIIVLSTFPLAIALAACSQAEETEMPVQDQPIATTIAMATLQLADGTQAGTATITDTGKGVAIDADVQNIGAGPHGFHLHETGSCDAPDFKTAGGHLNPLGKSHGTQSPDGAHAGDLLNIEVAPDGTGSLKGVIEGNADQVSQWLFDDDGTAVMVHAGPDDYRTDPSGDAGSRVACGVLTRS